MSKETTRTQAFLEKLKEDPTGQRMLEWFNSLEDRYKTWLIWSLVGAFFAVLMLIPWKFYRGVKAAESELANYNLGTAVVALYSKEDGKINQKLSELGNAFKLRGSSSIKNLVTSWLGELGFPEEALVSYVENPGVDSNEAVSVIQASLTIEQMNAKNITELLRRIESPSSGIVMDSLNITQDPKLDGFLKVAMTLRAYSLTGK